jgi:hypothetical protein
MCHAFQAGSTRREGYGNPPDSVPPEGLDWDTWIGPAPWRPYNKAYHPFNWRGCRDFSGGQTTDWGAHTFGGALFACNLHETGPAEVILPDGKDYKQLTFKFANGIQIHHGGGWGGIISFQGTKGKISEQDRSRFA